MSKSTRLVVLILSALAVLAPSAHAVTWHNSGDTAFTASTSLLGYGTFSSTGVNVVCGGHTTTGTAGVTSFAGTTWTAAQWTARFTNCMIAGISTTMDCQQSFTAESQSGGTTSGMVDTQCEAYVVGTSWCRIEGTQAGTYTNPAGTVGTFTLPLTTGLQVTGGAVGPCPLGNGDVLTWSAHTLRIATATGGPAPHTGPVFARTP